MNPKPEKRNEIVGLSDSSYSNDPDNRLSTSGYVIFYSGAPVSFRSRSQRTVTLSSTEAEYVAMTKTVTDMLFIKQVVESLGETVKLPMTVY